MLHLGRVGSTNDVALALAARGAPEGTVVVADRQGAGRGRRGRAWESPAGGNLYASIVLRPSRPLREWPELSWAVAGSVAAAAAAAGAGDVALKAPNDVLVAGRKLAGVLLESRSAPGRPAAVVAGLGVNLVSAPDPLRGGLRLPAVSLAETARGTWGAAAFLGESCAALARLYAAWHAGGAGALLEGIAAAGVDVAALRAAGTPGSLEGTGEPQGEG